MLSKEKIEKQANEKWGFLKEKYKNTSTYYYWDAMERGSIDGATWASEQYAGVVKALEEMVEVFNENWELTGATHRARLTAISELNKLKQP